MRAFIRRVAEPIASAMISPLMLAHRLRLVTYPAGGEMLSLVPAMLGMMLRRAWYRQTLDHCGTGLSVAVGAVLHEPGARVGEDCHFGPYSRIGLVTTGDDVMVAGHCEIISGAHQYGTSRAHPLRTQRLAPERVHIGDDVWIGAGAVVAADVSTGTIVAAGAVVVTPVLDTYALVGGVPARRLGDRH